jgi:hypothetical protein
VEICKPITLPTEAIGTSAIERFVVGRFVVGRFVLVSVSWSDMREEKGMRMKAILFHVLLNPLNLIISSLMFEKRSKSWIIKK